MVPRQKPTLQQLATFAPAIPKCWLRIVHPNVFPDTTENQHRTMTVNSSPGLSSHRGTFVISLDFELYWGLFDQTELTPAYRDIFARTRDFVIPKMLEMFRQYDVHATWATVGMLFFGDKATLQAALPDLQTTYSDPALSAYAHLTTVGENEVTDPNHYAPSLVKKIQSYPNQEVGSHTFSHYYCLEDGQTPAMFKADMDAWNRAAAIFGEKATSVCFARNQYAQPYLDICHELGVQAFRGNEKPWAYRPDSYQNENVLRKIFRWIDTYLPITQHQIRSLNDIGATQPYDIASSRFLRAYQPKLRWFEPLKVQRVLQGMTHAAKRDQVYHLWWHPQDFGEHTKHNLEMLEQILQHFAGLRRSHGMTSLNMAEVVALLEANNNNPTTKAVSEAIR